jgi:hypothetical protein
MPWQRGKSGNPGGKRCGTRHRTTIAAETLLFGEAEALTRRCIELALEGDVMALRMCLDRICPVRRSRPVPFKLPEVSSTGDLPKAMAAVLAGVADGLLAPDEAASLGALLETQRRMIETVELERRVLALEARRDTA